MVVRFAPSGLFVRGGAERYSPNCRQRLSEKGSERGFGPRFGQYTNAKTTRKVPSRCPVRLRCRGVRDFSDSLTRRILGNPHSSGPTPMSAGRAEFGCLEGDYLDFPDFLLPIKKEVTA